MKQQGRSAEKIVFIPRVWPISIGLRITNKPAVAVNASVRTADMAPTGMSQHANTETLAENVVAKIVCAAGRYRPAAPKSIDFSSFPSFVANSCASLSSLIRTPFLNMHTPFYRHSD